MQQKRMSLTLNPKSAIKQQMDHLLEADYQLLREHPQEPSAVLHCQLTHNNHIIKDYIRVVEDEYNVPNPLHAQPARTSSKKKLELSILNSSKEHFDPRNGDKNKKRLTLTSQKRSNQSSTLQINQITQQNNIIMTPKFFEWDHDSDKNASNYLAFDSSGSKNLKEYPSVSLNRIASKEKPINEQGQHKRSTAKKGSHPDETQLSHHNFESRLTIKKIEKSPLPYDAEESNDSMHSNPIINKMSKKNLEEYCRPGRIASSIIQQSPNKKIKIKDSYRYCIGCELPILENNIRPHEKECKPFQDISALPSNLEVLRVVRQKIAAIQGRIPACNQQIEEEHVQVVRNKSANLVRESRRRADCSPETANFRKDYESIMEIGKKWCSSLEEVNKLRWFTRIAQKLEAILTQQQ